MLKPVDTSRLEVALCLVAPRMRTDQAGQPRKDRDGVTQWVTSVAVTVNNGRRADSDVIDVVVPGEPQGITAGMPVALVDLWHNDWAIDGRSGESWSAAAITPAGTAAGSSSPAARSKSGGGDA